MPICIAGHVGVGHVFTHSGFVQDDSQGFAAASDLLCDRFEIDPSITEVTYDEGEKSITVRLSNGGTGTCVPGRGVTPFERELLGRLIGENSCFPQRTAMKAFGRMYGNGAVEVPVAVEYAVAQALMNGFNTHIDGFVMDQKKDEYAGDIVGGVRLEIDGMGVVILLTVNGSPRGVGPNEDLEGNVARDVKKKVMSELGVLDVPAILLESKAYNPSLEGIEEETLLLRYNRDSDNETVGNAVQTAFETMFEEEDKTDRSGAADGAPTAWKVIDNTFVRDSGAMKKNVGKYADWLADIADRLRKSTTSDEKVRIGEELAHFASQDFGGIVFMSDEVNEVVGAAGLMPGTGAVLSTVVPQSYVEETGIPYSTEEGIRMIQRVVTEALRNICAQKDQADRELQRKRRAV